MVNRAGGRAGNSGTGAVVSDPSNDPSDVYYIHASDGPNTISVKPVLNYSNYQVWARSMRRALGGKNKFEFVDGSIEVPTEFDPNFKAWNRCNNLVHSWILNSMDDSISQSLVFLDNAIDVWNELKERFSQGDYIRVSELQCEIFALKQDSKTVSEFFTSLKILWEELEAYFPAPVCSCPMRCVCTSGIVNAKHQHEVTHSIRFLTGLNDTFDPVRAQILLMNPLPSLNKIFSMVIQHERQYNSTHFDDSKVLINAHDSRKGQGRGRGNGGYSSNQGGNRSNTFSAKGKECSYCGKTNHVVENCYKKHGFPPNYGKSTAANNTSLDSAEDREDVDDTKSVRGQSNNVDTFGFTKEQYNHLVSLLNASNASSSKVNIASGHVTSGITNLTCSLNSSIGSWIVDSGASDHICSSMKFFSSYTSIKPIIVRLPNGNSSIARYSGTVEFSPSFLVKQVLFVPDFHLNLISVPKLCIDNMYNVSFNDDQCLIQERKNSRMIGLGKLVEGLYYLTVDKAPIIASSQTQAQSSSFIPKAAVWHFKFGHLSHNRLLELNKSFPFVKVDSNSACDICHYARHRKSKFTLSTNRASACYELFHFDIWGPLAVSSIHSHRYFLTAVDDYSRFTWVILCKTKSEIPYLVQKFIVMIENQYNCHVKTVRTDNGPEFALHDFYASKGIQHQTSCVETPQQNGRVERKHQHILNVGRALLFQSKLPKHFWSYAILQAVYIINRIPSPLLNNKSPYSLCHNKDPDLTELKVFGCLCYASTIQNHRTKLDTRSRKSVYLGIKQGVKGAVLYDLNSRNIFVSRNVTFHEQILPYQSSDSKFHWKYYTDPDHSQADLSAETVTYIDDDLDHSTTPTSPLNSDSTPNSDSILNSESNSNHISDPVLHSETNPDTTTPNITRKSSRVTHRPTHLSDYVCNLSAATNKPSSTGILYHISHYHSCSNLSVDHSKFALSLSADDEPASYQQASQHDCWVKAMNNELDALRQNKTWIFVDAPPHVKPIGSRWVYKIKHKADGTIERYQARLVAKGYNQIEGIDFFETFSHVAKITTVRTLIALAAMNSWHLHQLDVNNAFLHGDLHEDVYMTIPQGVHHSKPNQVCKLLKSLYGTRISDHSLFTLKHDNTFTALLVYVDDIILAGNSLDEFQRIKKLLDSEFKIKDLGQLKYFLGIEVAHSKIGVTICQRKYCLDLLHDTGLLGAKPAKTPFDNSVKLHQDDTPPYEDIAGYRRLVGKLLYLTTTRPDIAFVTQQLSQFLSTPTQTHYDTACRVVRYLKGSPGRGLLFRRDAQLQLLGFTDADWAGCLDSRRSTSGYCFFLGSSLISWRAKKQHTVSRSSSEAEYRALSFASCELQWLVYLLTDLNVQCAKPPVLYCDNQSALHIAANPVFHERTKHLEIDCHFVREKLQQGVFKLLPIHTKSQLADFFTKALPPKAFSSFITKLNMLDIYHA
ncbi:putative mitochondrial protein [Trifolium repens]|nr:putative mitochondrial protein [Trifolium repens]